MTTAARLPRLDFSRPHVLRNDEEYAAAVAMVDALLELSSLNTQDSEQLDFLTVLIEAYDEEHFPMGDTSSPQSIVAFMLDQRGMSRGDLATIMGGKSRVSEFFAGKRRLSIAQVRRLRAMLNVPADLLM